MLIFSLKLLCDIFHDKNLSDTNHLETDNDTGCKDPALRFDNFPSNCSVIYFMIGLVNNFLAMTFGI